jgi:hypothetical protein
MRTLTILYRSADKFVRTLYMSHGIVRIVKFGRLAFWACEHRALDIDIDIL